MRLLVLISVVIFAALLFGSEDSVKAFADENSCFLQSDFSTPCSFDKEEIFGDYNSDSENAEKIKIKKEKGKNPPDIQKNRCASGKIHFLLNSFYKQHILTVSSACEELSIHSFLSKVFLTL